MLKSEIQFSEGLDKILVLCVPTKIIDYHCFIVAFQSKLTIILFTALFGRIYFVSNLYFQVRRLICLYKIMQSLFWICFLKNMQQRVQNAQRFYFNRTFLYFGEYHYFLVFYFCKTIVQVKLQPFFPQHCSDVIFYLHLSN